ncbi:MAG: serine/threonine-protein kinase RsbW [Candidatus Poribacteria bacterium]|nr:serine/threonine-protein kinase RsbW [Candidatus Poribacteria bacterium]
MKIKNKIQKRDITLDIPSEVRHIYLLDNVLAYVAKEMNFDEETREQVNLAVIEAGTNAIKHGNKNDPNKMVHFRFNISNNKLTVYVKDSGCGFDPSNLDDPLSPENVMKPCGRGIFLMKALMDEVEFTMIGECGTEVKMVKYKIQSKLDDSDNSGICK